MNTFRIKKISIICKEHIWIDVLRKMQKKCQIENSHFQSYNTRHKIATCVYFAIFHDQYFTINAKKIKNTHTHTPTHAHPVAPLLQRYNTTRPSRVSLHSDDPTTTATTTTTDTQNQASESPNGPSNFSLNTQKKIFFFLGVSSHRQDESPS